MNKLIEGIKGRFNSIRDITLNHQPQPNTVWFHAASYGEYKQCQSIISSLKRERPDISIVLTFFSPSGYNNFDGNKDIHNCYYLPTATRHNAKKFLDLIIPICAVLMVGDYWPAYLWELRKRHIPIFVVSARFKPSSAPFHWYGWPVKHAIQHCLTSIMAQNQASKELLQSINISNVEVCGDPRLDALFSIKSFPWKDPVIEIWANSERVFVAGSICHKGDFSVISSLANNNRRHKFLVATHEIDYDTVRCFTSMLEVPYQLYSEACRKGSDPSATVLVIDCIGILSLAYRYSRAAYVGGGFHTDEPHSVIEPAIWGIPVFFGPRYKNNPHCKGLLEANAALSIKDKDELLSLYHQLDRIGGDMGRRALSYCQSRQGASRSIVPVLLEAIP